MPEGERLFPMRFRSDALRAGQECRMRHRMRCVCCRSRIARACRSQSPESGREAQERRPTIAGNADDRARGVVAIRPPGPRRSPSRRPSENELARADPLPPDPHPAALARGRRSGGRVPKNHSGSQDSGATPGRTQPESRSGRTANGCDDESSRVRRRADPQRSASDSSPRRGERIASRFACPHRYVHACRSYFSRASDSPVHRPVPSLASAP